MTRRTKKKKNLYWGYNNNKNTISCQNLILSYIKFDIPIISNNINKLCTEFNNLNDMIKVLYNISKYDMSTEQKIIEIGKIKDNTTHKQLFNASNSNLILDKINNLDNIIVQHIGGSGYCIEEKVENVEKVELCKDASINFTPQEIRFFKSLAIKWNPQQLIFQTLGSTLYISYIGDFIALCFSLITGNDRMTPIILGLSLILFGLGNAIKFGYLAYDMRSVIKIVEPKLSKYNI